MIDFNFKVVRSDAELRVMDVEYSAVGYDNVLIGMQLPLEGEELNKVIIRNAPIAQWEASKKSVVAVQVGTEGSITAAEFAAAMVEQETSLPIPESSVPQMGRVTT